MSITHAIVGLIAHIHTTPGQLYVQDLFSISVVTNSLKDGSRSQNKSTSGPVILMVTVLSISAFKYTPLISVMQIDLPYIMSMMLKRKNASCETVYDAVCSFVQSPCCTFPLK